MTVRKTILITGGASGFGKATALKLIEAGHIIYPADLRLDAMDELKARGARPLQMDVTDVTAVKAGIDSIIADEGHIDVCVNNAGFGLYDLVENGNIDRARQMFEVNFWGTVNVTRAVLPHMRTAGSGRIVNISSLAGRVAGPMTGWYSASKFAVEAFSDALRLECSVLGITVALIEPGSHKTGFGDVVINQFDHIDPAPEYKSLVDQYVASYVPRQRNAPGPDAVVDAMVDSALSETPKTRYVVGADAEAAVAARTAMSDAEFDAVSLQSLGITRT